MARRSAPGARGSLLSQALARRKRLTAKNRTTDRIATSSNASNQGAGRSQPTSPGQPTRILLRAPNHDPGLPESSPAPGASNDGGSVDLDEQPGGQAGDDVDRDGRRWVGWGSMPPGWRRSLRRMRGRRPRRWSSARRWPGLPLRSRGWWLGCGMPGWPAPRRWADDLAVGVDAVLRRCRSSSSAVRPRRPG
jgi:hypothetical protein